MIDVLEEQVDRRQPLGQAALERPPLRRGDDARQQVERKDALGALVVAVDGEGDALGQKRLVRFELTLAQLGLGRAAQLLEQRAAVRPRLPRRLEHLVVVGVEHVVAEQRAERLLKHGIPTRKRHAGQLSRRVGRTRWNPAAS